MTNRERIIRQLQAIDPNGVWSDEDNIAEGWQPLTLASAWRYLKEFEKLANED